MLIPIDVLRRVGCSACERRSVHRRFPHAVIDKSNQSFDAEQRVAATVAAFDNQG
jgi:hypothetical protein